MNSRAKGARGERQWRDELREAGFAARRGQQFSGSPESPDVICDDLWFIHFEVKCVERLNIEDAMDQARRQARPARNAASPRTSSGLRPPSPQSGEGLENLMPVVAHKRKHRRWLVTLEAKDLFRLLRGAVPEIRRDAKSDPRDAGATRSDACPTGWRRIQGEAGSNVNDVTLRIPRVVGSEQNKNNQKKG